MKKQAVLIFILIAFSFCSVVGQDLQTALGSQIDIVVARDGSGDFTNIMDAVYSVPKNKSTRTVIFVRNGTYNEKLEIENGINKVTLIGENVDSTFVVRDDYSGSGEPYNGIMTSRIGDPIGTSTSHTMYIDCDEFILMNFTVVNNAGRVGQAVAVNLGGDRTILVHCRILGNQDTFYTWGYGRFLMYDCFIEGNVDFIFGRGVALFDSCLINTNRSSCRITAASTDQDWKFGYVFQNCKIIANRGVSGVTMGRPWKTYAQTVFMHCFLDKQISRSGWTDWDGRSATCYYAEYRNFGPGSDTSGRASWSNQLSDSEAQNYTRTKLFAKDVNPSNFSSDWAPDIHSDPVYKVLKASTGLLYLDSLQNNADLKSITVNGTAIEDFDPADRIYTINLYDTTTVIPEISAEILAPRSTMVIENPASLPGNVTISVSAINGFTQTYTVKYNLATGIGDLLKSTKLDAQLLYGPLGETLLIRINEVPDAKHLYLSLYSSNGQLAVSKTYSAYNSGEDLSVDVSHIVPGMYICRMTAGEKTFQKLVLKQ